MRRGDRRDEHASAGDARDGRREKGKRPLPHTIKVRIAHTHRHFTALALALEETARDRFVSASASTEPRLLNRHVYPIERGFEILGNFVAELNEKALEESGLTPGDRPTNLRLLEREGVISGERARKWRDILAARNELQHDYPDIRAAGIYDAAVALRDDLPDYLRDYIAWLRKLGFG